VAERFEGRRHTLATVLVHQDPDAAAEAEQGAS
jgi:hypothetical protein